MNIPNTGLVPYNPEHAAIVRGDQIGLSSKAGFFNGYIPELNLVAERKIRKTAGKPIPGNVQRFNNTSFRPVRDGKIKAAGWINGLFQDIKVNVGGAEIFGKGKVFGARTQSTLDILRKILPKV